MKGAVEHENHRQGSPPTLLTGTRAAPPPAGPQPPLEPLRDSEIRVLHYLPINLTAPEIARAAVTARPVQQLRFNGRAPPGHYLQGY